LTDYSASFYNDDYMSCLLTTLTVQIDPFSQQFPKLPLKKVSVSSERLDSESRRKKTKQERRVICWPVENQLLTERIEYISEYSPQLTIEPHSTDEET
jgi:hypothetical protein